MQFILKNNSKSLPAWSLLAVPVFLLAGCSGGGSGSDGTEDVSGTSRANASSQIIEGVALKGAIADGIVNVYAVEQHAGYHQIAPNPLASAVRTQADGSFRVHLKTPTNSALVVRVSADEKTLMLCDVSAGCKNANGGLIPFGQAMRVPVDFAMTAAVAASQATRLSVPVTPLTQLAFSWSETQTAGLTSANIDLGRVKVATALDLPPDILSRAPVDLTQLSPNAIVDTDTLTYSLISSSFLALANDNAWLDLNDVLESASQRFATTGDLVAVNLGGLPEVAKSDLLYAAAETAEELAQTLGLNRTLGQNLDQIATRTEATRTALVAASESQSLNITFNPSSISLHPTETATLNVNASGTGPIFYQWRKDGVAIEGATQEHLTLAEVSEGDAGIYDCIVSNQYGSLSSLAANVEVLDAAVSLSWTAPTTRADGTPLDARELQGYRLFHGTSADNLEPVDEILDPSVTSYSFGMLPETTHYFAIKAIDLDGNESALSEPVSKTL